MITKFSKGFYGHPKAHAAFMSAVEEGDCNEISTAIALGGSERKFVDPDIFATPRAILPHRTLVNAEQGHVPEPDSTEFYDNLKFVTELAEVRDELISPAFGFDRGLSEVSPFLYEFERVPLYPAGLDYGTDKASWERIQRGEVIPEKAYTSPARTQQIKTYRDLSAYVHSDHYLIPYLRLLDTLFAEGHVPKVPGLIEQNNFDNIQRFALCGNPFWGGVLGAVVRDMGLVSFWWKWKRLYPRPEEATPYYDLGYLKLAYPEGSPMHPSCGQMHEALAEALGHTLVLAFGPETHVEFTGESLESTTNLLASNIGLGRNAAGVHYPFDGDAIRPAARAVAKYHVDSVVNARR